MTMSPTRAETGPSLLERGRNLLRNPLAIATLAGVAAASLVGGVAKASGQEGSKAKVGAEISAVDNSFKSVVDSKFSALRNLILGRSMERPAADRLNGLKAVESKLDNTAAASADPGVQAFEVVASNDPTQTPSSELITSLHGVQTYFNKNGNGMRVKFRENSNGTYNVPIIRIGMTQEKLATASETEVFKAIQDALPDESGINTTSLGYVKGANFKVTCNPQAGSLPNPENLGIVSLQSNCTHPDRSPGFGARDVQAAQTIIFASKITWFVRDDKDPLNFDKVPFWDLTYINHSRKYDAIYSSPYFQRHVPIQKSGPGELKISPTPDNCREDCGTTPLFTQGKPVELTAQPAANGKFKSWQNCPSPEGNICEVDLANLQNDPMQPVKPIVAEFINKIPPPKEKYTLDARVIKGAEFGSISSTVFNNGKKTNVIKWPTTQKGKIVTIIPARDVENAYLVNMKGCENKELKQKLVIAIGKKCLIKMDEEKETVTFVFSTSPVASATDQP